MGKKERKEKVGPANRGGNTLTVTKKKVDTTETEEETKKSEGKYIIHKTKTQANHRLTHSLMTFSQL